MEVGQGRRFFEHMISNLLGDRDQVGIAFQISITQHRHAALPRAEELARAADLEVADLEASDLDAADLETAELDAADDFAALDIETPQELPAEIEGAFDADPFALPREPAPEEAAEAFSLEPALAEQAFAPPPALTTREVIEQARAATRAASQPEGRNRRMRLDAEATKELTNVAKELKLKFPTKIA